MRPEVRATALLLLLSAWSAARGPSSRTVGRASWPSWSHPLGIDPLGRDFAHVLAEGALELALPVAVATGLVLALCFWLSWSAAGRPLLDDAGGPAESGALLWTAPPRLLAVMLVSLALPEPSPWVSAMVVAALRAPLLVHEAGAVIRSLRRDQVLLGLIAHGLPRGWIAARHLVGGHLRPTCANHCATVAAEASFTQIALSHVFGGSATSQGLSASWGMELRRLSQWFPGPAGAACGSDGPCVPWVATFQAAALLAVVTQILGGWMPRGPGAR